MIETALPQYIPAAVEQNRLEKTSYDLWRQGDPAARASLRASSAWCSAA